MVFLPSLPALYALPNIYGEDPATTLQVRALCRYVNAGCCHYCS
ncbi:hypothetical protein P4S64_23990 [Vibrio sp. M60_M31a]